MTCHLRVRASSPQSLDVKFNFVLEKWDTMKYTLSHYVSPLPWFKYFLFLSHSVGLECSFNITTTLCSKSQFWYLSQRFYHYHMYLRTLSSSLPSFWSLGSWCAPLLQCSLSLVINKLSRPIKHFQKFLGTYLDQCAIILTIGWPKSLGNSKIFSLD